MWASLYAHIRDATVVSSFFLQPHLIPSPSTIKAFPPAILHSNPGAEVIRTAVQNLEGYKYIFHIRQDATTQIFNPSKRAKMFTL